ncbi:MAG TPA: M12 family metallo-peptidase [Ignavibacteria bacterium]|jgi:hypothetical protein
MKNKIHKSAFFAVAYIILISVNVLSQSSYNLLFSVNGEKTSSQPEWVKNSVEGAVILNIDKNQLQQIISRKENKINISFPFAVNRTTELILERFDITDANTKIVSGTAKGDVPISLKDKLVSYMGKVEGINNSLVSVTFSNDRIVGLVNSGNDIYVLGKLSETSTTSEYILYQTSRLKTERHFNCGSDAFEIPERIRQLQNSISGNFSPASSNLLRADIAVESDYETFTRFGTVQNTSTYLLSLMSTVSAVYVRDINVRLVVTYLRVWTDINDPYTGTTSNALLNEFRNYWNANMQGTPRTIAHYITTRPGNLGGIAWLNVLCANLAGGYGYAFSNIDGVFNNLPAYSWDVMVVSHETGHNFGSPHTHNCGWPGGPIDSCYATEGGCYTGPPIPRIGTIMSYCHLNGSISLVQGFGPLPTDLIRNSAENASCIQSLTGFFVAKPNGGEIYRSGNAVLIIWGTSITGNVNIEYSTNNGSSWQVIQNNVSATLRNITWQAPYMPTTTQARVRVSESGNPANNDISDSVFQIRPTLQLFNMISPPLFERIYVSPGDTSKIYFTWSKTGNLPEIKYKWFLNTFGNAPIYNQFSNNSGSDSVLTITKGRIDSIIAAFGITTGDSLRGKWLVKSYSQLDSLNPTTTSFIITFIRGLIGINPISSIIPKEFFVNQNYPNPFNPSTKIKFGLPKNEVVIAKVYDLIGREIEVLANGELKAGEYEIDWNADGLPSGVYFIKIGAGNDIKILRTVLLK